jgi:hypothetical protein
MGYIHVEIDGFQSSKKKDSVCGDCYSSFRTPEATYLLLADGIGSGIKANVYANMAISRLKSLLAQDFSLRNAFAQLVKTMHQARGTELPYSVFTVAQILKNGETTILAYEMPEGIFVGRHSATCFKRRDFTLGHEVISETNLFLEPGEGIILYSDGISLAGIGVSTRVGWESKDVSRFVNDCIYDGSRRRVLAKAVHDRARQLWKDVGGDDCTAVSAFCRQGRVANLFTGPSIDKGNDAENVRDFMSYEGFRIVCGATTAGIVARHIGKPLKINQADNSLIAPPGYSIDGIDLVTEGAVTLNQAYNVLDADLLELEPDSSVTRLCEMLTDSDRVNFFIGKASNQAHEDISFRQRGIVPRQKIVRLLAERLRQLGKLVHIIEL